MPIQSRHFSKEESQVQQIPFGVRNAPNGYGADPGIDFDGNFTDLLIQLYKDHDEHESTEFRLLMRRLTKAVKSLERAGFSFSAERSESITKGISEVLGIWCEHIRFREFVEVNLQDMRKERMSEASSKG